MNRKTKKKEKAAVLIVDDDEFILVRLEKLLKLAGYEVFTAVGGAAAVSSYRERAGEIDVVVVDYLMPDMNGREVFDALRLINPEVRVVVCSGFVADGETDRMLRDGAAGFLMKPYIHTEMYEAIDKAYNKR